MRATRILRRLARLGPREWVELLQAQLALLGAQARVWTRPTGRLVHGAAASPAPAVLAEEAPLDARVERLALAVSRAGDYGVFRPLCLVRAVALSRLLERRGIRGSRIRIGVRIRRGRFGAHAWVEYGGRVIGDSPEHVESFAELADVRLLDTR